MYVYYIYIIYNIGMYISDYTVWTDTVKDDEWICEEKSVSESRDSVVFLFILI
jgi:hypothetical protein